MSRLGLAVLFLLLATVAGCAPPFDADQLRLCRQTLPALNPDGAEFRIYKVIPLPERSAVRIEYAVKVPGAATRNRLVGCRFARSTLRADTQELIGLRDDGQAMNKASLYLLKRFWLDTADASLADPGEAAMVGSRGWQLPREVAILMQHAVSALPGMAIYALLASAYALVYGLVGRINLAFGEFAALGGVAASLGVTIALLGGHGSVALVLISALCTALFVTVLHAAVVARLVLQPLADRPGQHVLVATIGLAIALQEYMRLSQGTGTRWVSPIFNTPFVLAHAPGFLVTVTPVALAAAIIAFTAAAGVLLMMRYSRFGRQWLAVADDPLAAALFGVSSLTVYAQTFALACGMAGLTGVIITLYYGGIGFAGGASLGLKALVGAVAGGIGSVPGAMLGGLLVGVVETVWSAFLPLTNRDIVLYVLLIVLLALKPGGLFGFGQLLPRRV